MTIQNKWRELVQSHPEEVREHRIWRTGQDFALAKNLQSASVLIGEKAAYMNLLAGESEDAVAACRISVLIVQNGGVVIGIKKQEKKTENSPFAPTD